MSTIRVAVNGYGVIGKRVADAVRLQEQLLAAASEPSLDLTDLGVGFQPRHRSRVARRWALTRRR